MHLHLHTTHLQDGYDWGRLNLQSVTEQDTYTDFMNTAEMAGREFDAEKWNVKLLDAQTRQVAGDSSPDANFLKPLSQTLHLVHLALANVDLSK